MIGYAGSESKVSPLLAAPLTARARFGQIRPEPPWGPDDASYVIC
jgi:hypothetical protein